MTSINTVGQRGRLLPNPPRTAFTLVELLVVIGIISVLISILLPALGKVKDAANSTKCLANMQQVAITVAMYTNENAGKWLPPYRVPDRTPNYVPQGSAGNWNGAPYFFTWLSGKYLKESPLVWVCPTDRFVETVAAQLRLTANIRDSRTSYLMNRDMPTFGAPIYAAPYDHVYFAPRPMSPIKRPTRLIVFAESSSGFGLASYRSTAAAGQPEPLRFDHRKGRVMSICFADGHAEQLDRTEILLRPGETTHGPGRIREYWYGHPTYTSPKLIYR